MSSQKSSKPERKVPKNEPLAPGCLALTLSPILNRKESDSESLRSSANSHGQHQHHHRKAGKELFRDFQRENKHSFWNKPLAESVKEVAYLGWLEPWVLLIRGGDRQLECLREAYARRVLKPPKNFTIANLGDVCGIEMTPILQHQFIPLTEVLCLIISEMNKRRLRASPDTIRDKLAECYAKMPVPSPEIIHKSLNHLMTEQKIEHSNGRGYMIVGLDRLPPDSPSGDELEPPPAPPPPAPAAAAKAKASKPAEERVYLVYKDGALTRHSLPTASNMVDKSTQTVRSRSDSSSSSPSPRPISYPANNSTNMSTIYEKSHTIGTSSPSKQAGLEGPGSSGSGAAVPLQRSLSMRERRSPAKRGAFERSSMRAATVAASAVDTGYFTSDSEAKQSCFGRLLGKTAKKKAAAAAAAAAAASSGQADLQTFSAQFPPSDIHDPFFNYAHWLGKSPQKVALNSVNATSSPKHGVKDKHRPSSGSSPSHASTASAKKDGSKSKSAHRGDTNHYKLEHGRLTQTAKALNQKYQDTAQESMPESEKEFVKPTQLYNDKYRTKVVADQAQPTKGKKGQSASTRPLGAPPDGPVVCTTDDQNDSEIELQRRSDLAAEKRRQKLEQLKERRQARIFTAHRVARESTEMADPMDYPPAGLELPNGPASPQQSPGHSAAKQGGVEAMETPEPIRRQVFTNQRNESTETMRQRAPARSPETGPFPAALRTPKNANAYRGAEQPAANCNEYGAEQPYYRDEEIDNFMRQEQRRAKMVDDDMQDPMLSPQRDGRAYPTVVYPQRLPPREAVGERREGLPQMTMAVNPRPLSLHGQPPLMDNEKPPPPPPIRFGSPSERSPSQHQHQPPVHSVHPSQVLLVHSPTTHAGRAGSDYPASHQRVESLASSAGDSGFNSPRSSLAQSQNNNSPVDPLAYDPLHHRHSTGGGGGGSNAANTGIPVLIKPIPRRTQPEVVDNQASREPYDNANRLIKSTSNPTHLHGTPGGRPAPVVGGTGPGAELSAKRKFRSSDTVDANSDISEKTAYSSVSRRSRLERPKSFEVIGTV